MSQGGFDDTQDFPSMPPRMRRARADSDRPRSSEPFPSACTTAFIMDLVFCVLRLGLTFFSIIGYNLLKQQGSPLAKTAIFEIIFGFGIGLVGVAAAGLMLAKQKWAAALGYIVMLLVVGSILVGIWQFTLTLGLQGADPARRMGFIVGALFGNVLRLALLGFYGYAVMQFSKWAERNA